MFNIGTVVSHAMRCGQHSRRDFDRPNTFAVRFSLVQFGSLWFNMASVDIINFENKYDVMRACLLALIIVVLLS